MLEYIYHYLTQHSDLCPYTCAHCDNVYFTNLLKHRPANCNSILSRNELDFHTCREELEIGGKDDNLQILEASPWLDKISKALATLPPLPSHSEIACWIFENIPPPPEDQLRANRSMLRSLRTTNTFFEAKPDGWKEIEKTKQMDYVHYVQLIHVIVYNAKFEALTLF